MVIQLRKEHLFKNFRPNSYGIRQLQNPVAFDNYQPLWWSRWISRSAVCVCPSMWTTFELNVFWPRYLAAGSILALSTTSSKVTIIDQSSGSQGGNVAKVAGATSSAGYLFLGQFVSVSKVEAYKTT